MSSTETLQDRLAWAILEIMDSAVIGDDWPHRVADEVLLQVAAELTAHEQLAGRPLAYTDAITFLCGAKP